MLEEMPQRFQLWLAPGSGVEAAWFGSLPPAGPVPMAVEPRPVE